MLNFPSPLTNFCSWSRPLMSAASPPKRNIWAQNAAGYMYLDRDYNLLTLAIDWLIDWLYFMYRIRLQGKTNAGCLEGTSSGKAPNSLLILINLWLFQIVGWFSTSFFCFGTLGFLNEPKERKFLSERDYTFVKTLEDNRLNEAL